MKTKISDMMDSIPEGMLDSMVIQHRDIASTEKIQEAVMKKIHAHTPLQPPRRATRIVLIAAILALALSISAAAVYYFSLRDLESPAYEIGGENTATLSFSGMPQSPEFAAAQEWEAYLQAAFQAGENRLTPDAAGQEPDAYFWYGAHSPEAKAALDAILEKYSLSMHHSPTDIRSLDALYAAVGSSAFLPEPGESQLPISGRLYPDGTFQMNAAAALPNGSSVTYQCYAFTKGYLTRSANLLADASAFTEWLYTLPNGIQVLLAANGEQAILAADLENSFVIVRFLTEDGSAIDSTMLESLAESFDFSILDSLAQ